MQAGQHSVEAVPQPRRVVFDHTVEWLFQPSVRVRLSPTAYMALGRLGLDLSAPLRPAYDFETWRASLTIVAADLFPGAPTDEAWRRLGHMLVRGVERTAMGRAMLRVAKLLGPTRALRRMNETFSSADNYVKSILTEHGPGDCDLWINEVMNQPGYYQGILEMGLTLTGAHAVRVEVRSREGAGATLHLTWDE